MQDRKYCENQTLLFHLFVLPFGLYPTSVFGNHVHCVTAPTTLSPFSAD